jgi:3-phosphoshikimate 1-carboxyvinyltransferase
LLDALKMLGATYTIDPSAPKDLPFTITGPITGGTTEVDGFNSQYVSSLLFACPLVNGDTTIIANNLHEHPYVRMTLWWLDKMGIRYEAADDLSRFLVYGNQQYHPIDIRIPGDFSGATFAAVVGAIAAKAITIDNLDFTDPQGDKEVFNVITSLGAKVDIAGTGATVSPLHGLVGTTVDLNSMPDALPAIAVAACSAKGETRIVNVAQARIKETDRIAVMTAELKKMGADITECNDGMIIRQSALKGAHVNGHHDHRVVMALALAGMIADGETCIDTAEAAAVTYPTFRTDYTAIGGDIRIG